MTLANGNVTCNLPPILANAIAANARQATCTNDRKRQLSGPGDCLLRDVEHVATVVHNTPALVEILTLLNIDGPRLAAGFVESVVVAAVDSFTDSGLFSFASDIRLLEIATVLVWAVYIISQTNVYSGSAIEHITIPASEISSSTSATRSAASTASCPSITLSATTVVRPAFKDMVEIPNLTTRL